MTLNVRDRAAARAEFTKLAELLSHAMSDPAMYATPHVAAVLDLLCQGLLTLSHVVLVEPLPAPPLPAPRRRLRACVEAWPECEEGKYDPRCCRFPKNCSCECYDETRVTEEDLERR